MNHQAGETENDEGKPGDVSVEPTVLRAPSGSLPAIVRAITFFETEYYLPGSDGSWRKLPVPLSANLQGMTGDRLIFTNDDDVIHNIHIFGPGGEDDSEDLGLQKPGKSLSYKFDKIGAYRVRCNIHPSVKMSVQVK